MNQKEQILKIIEIRIEFQERRLDKSLNFQPRTEGEKRRKDWEINYHERELQVLRSLKKQIKEEVK